MRGNLATKNRGVASPLAGAEETLVVLCIQMGKIRQPLNLTEGIALMNDMIKDTQMQEALKGFQPARHLGSNLFKFGEAGRGWWRGFMKRHGHRLVTKKGKRCACDRSDWTTLANIQ